MLTRPAEVVHAESAGMLSLSCGLVAVSLCLAVTYQSSDAKPDAFMGGRFQFMLARRGVHVQSVSPAWSVDA